MRVFYTFNMSDHIGLVVNNSVDGKDNLEEKTREVAYLGCITSFEIFFI